jgi:hypothetical protein
MIHISTEKEDFIGKLVDVSNCFFHSTLFMSKYYTLFTCTNCNMLSVTLNILESTIIQKTILICCRRLTGIMDFGWNVLKMSDVWMKMLFFLFFLFFGVVFFRALSVVFLLTIVLSALLRFTVSDITSSVFSNNSL